MFLHSKSCMQESLLQTAGAGCESLYIRQRIKEPLYRQRERVYTSDSLIWYATWPLLEKKKWPFDITPGVVGVFYDSIIAFMELSA